MNLNEVNLIWLTALVTQYLPLCIGVVAQFVFLLLPVDIKNWEYDTLNVLTYVVMQMFSAAIIFVAIPVFFQLYHLQEFTHFYIVITVGMLAVFRCLRIIPLENTNIEAVIVKKEKGLDFREFFDPKRIAAMVENNTDFEPNKPERFALLRQRLARRKIEKVDQIGG